jgi:hypothetical protein
MTANMTLLQQTLSRGLLAHIDDKEWEPVDALTQIYPTLTNKLKISGPTLMCLATNLVTIGRKIYAHHSKICPPPISILYQQIVQHFSVSEIKASFETTFTDRQTYIYVLCAIYLELYDPTLNSIETSTINNGFIKHIIMTERISKSDNLVSNLRKKIHATPIGYTVASLIANPLHRGADAFVPMMLTTDCYFMDSTVLLKSVTDELTTSLVIRLKNHMNVAPLYWKKVKPLYIDIFKTKSRDYNVIKTLIEASLDDIANIEFTREQFLTLTPVAWKIWILPPTLRAYYLGFPIHLGTMSNKLAAEYIVKYVQLGFQAYAKHMGDLGTSVIRPPLEAYGLVEFQSCTDDDLNGEPYNTYSPFDRMPYIEEGRVYEFARSYFEYLIKNKKNPFNKSVLASTFLSNISKRQDLAKAYNIPVCKPLVQHYIALGEKSDNIKDVTCETIHPRIIKSNMSTVDTLSADNVSTHEDDPMPRLIEQVQNNIDSQINAAISSTGTTINSQLNTLSTLLGEHTQLQEYGHVVRPTGNGTHIRSSRVNNNFDYLFPTSTTEAMSNFGAALTVGSALTARSALANSGLLSRLIPTHQHAPNSNIVTPPIINNGTIVTPSLLGTPITQLLSRLIPTHKHVPNSNIVTPPIVNTGTAVTPPIVDTHIIQSFNTHSNPSPMPTVAQHNLTASLNGMSVPTSQSTSTNNDPETSEIENESDIDTPPQSNVTVENDDSSDEDN